MEKYVRIRIVLPNGAAIAAKDMMEVRPSFKRRLVSLAFSGIETSARNGKKPLGLVFLLVDSGGPCSVVDSFIIAGDRKVVSSFLLLSMMCTKEVK